MSETTPKIRQVSLVFALAFILLGFDLIFLLADILVAQGSNHTLQEMFGLAAEGNVPTWWASLEWFLVAGFAGAAFFIDRRIPRWRRFAFMWLIIALAFFIASADEVAQIHETVGSYLRSQVDASDTLSHLVPQGPKDSPWIIFYALPLAGLGLASITFLFKRLNYRPPLIIYCIVAAELYAASIGLDWFQGCSEAVQRHWAEVLGVINSEGLVEATMTLEETLENVGTSLLILSFAGFVFDHVRVSVADAGMVPEQAEPPSIDEGSAGVNQSLS